VPVQYRVKRIIRPTVAARARARSCKRRHLCKRSTVAWSRKLSSRISRR
jgi:hypothetical protein